MRAIATAALSLAALAATFAAAPSAMGQAETAPDWIKRPRPEDFVAVFPMEAFRRGIGGRAKVSCTVTPQGTLRDCKVLEEDPPGLGFGAAALALMPQFMMKPATEGGRAVASTVNIPITFASPGKATGSRLRGPDAIGMTSVRNVPWEAAPTAVEVREAYPPKIKAQGQGGLAAFDCVISETGRLNGCELLSETPRNVGVGAAGRPLLSRFRAPAQDAASGRSFKSLRTTVNFTFAPEMLASTTPVIGRPKWVQLPAPEDLQAVLPEAAKKAGMLKARVVLACQVTPDGVLSECRTKSEEPSGYGYAAATQTLARKFKVSIWTEEGLPAVGGTVNVPIRFDFSDQTAAPAQP